MSGARGEAIIQAGEREVRALFTNRALAEAEVDIGRSIIEISRGFAAGRVGVGEIAKLLHRGMEAAQRDARAGNRMSLDSAYDVMDAAGYPVVARAIIEAIIVTMSHGSATKESGDVEAPPE
jgi:hypothetical protein